MFRKLCCSGVLLLAAWVMSPREAAAQYGPPSSYGDVISPYLNMNLMSNPGTSGLPIYQNLVEPFFDARQGIANNAAGINQLQNQLGGGGRGRGGGGSGRYFMNYSHYYSGIRR